MLRLVDKKCANCGRYLNDAFTDELDTCCGVPMRIILGARANTDSDEFKTITCDGRRFETKEAWNGFLDSKAANLGCDRSELTVMSTSDGHWQRESDRSKNRIGSNYQEKGLHYKG